MAARGRALFDDTYLEMIRYGIVSDTIQRSPIGHLLPRPPGELWCACCSSPGRNAAAAMSEQLALEGFVLGRELLWWLREVRIGPGELQPSE